MQQCLSWSDEGTAFVRDVAELDRLLDALVGQFGNEDRVIASLDGPKGESVFFGIGGHLSFVSSADEPYLTTIGDSEMNGETDYFFNGHHSQIQNRHLIPMPAAKAILREFFSSGLLSSWQEWTPI